MSENELVEALRNLPAVGQLVKDRGYRQVWRIEIGGRAYFLKWYPRGWSWLKRLFLGNPAFREFGRLIALQKASIPAPRAVAVLRGFRIDGRTGDAVILHAIEPSIQLDHYLTECDASGGHVPDRRRIAAELIELVYQLGRNRLGHADLHLGNILLSHGRLYLLDGYAVRNGGLRLRDVMMLGHSAGRWATRSEMIRGWRRLMASDGLPPARNSISPRLHRKFLSRTRSENAYFGKLSIDGWRGLFVKGLKRPRWWAAESTLRVTQEDWRRAWPELLAKLNRDELQVIKRSDSGDVLGGTITLGGRDVQIVLKRPRRKGLWRRISLLGRRSKARRSWFKAWKLLIRSFPAEWPLLLMERRALGYPLDSVLVVARVPGETLMETDLDALSPRDRQALFRRLGRTLRRLERMGFCHFDSKSSNWIVVRDEHRGPVPVMIDVDGIRHYRWDTFGIRRLLRSMKDHPQYTREDSRELCLGYAPFARVAQDDPEPAERA